MYRNITVLNVTQSNQIVILIVFVKERSNFTVNTRLECPCHYTYTEVHYNQMLCSHIQISFGSWGQSAESTIVWCPWVIGLAQEPNNCCVEEPGFDFLIVWVKNPALYHCLSGIVSRNLNSLPLGRMHRMR